MTASPADPGFILRAATQADIATITEIYGHHVRCGLGTFEEVPPTLEEMLRRHNMVTGLRLPYLVAAAGPKILGYAYVAPYRPRSAYRHSVEDSIYVAPDAMRKGIGLALLEELIERCTRSGYRQMIAVIGDSGNAGSVAVHERAGFHRIGIVRDIGFKAGRWVDTVLMQRALGEGGETLPTHRAPH